MLSSGSGDFPMLAAKAPGFLINSEKTVHKSC